MSSNLSQGAIIHVLLLVFLLLNMKSSCGEPPSSNRILRTCNFKCTLPLFLSPPKPPLGPSLVGESRAWFSPVLPSSSAGWPGAKVAPYVRTPPTRKTQTSKRPFPSPPQQPTLLPLFPSPPIYLYSIWDNGPRYDSEERPPPYTPIPRTHYTITDHADATRPIHTRACHNLSGMPQPSLVRRIKWPHFAISPFLPLCECGQRSPPVEMLLLLPRRRTIYRLASEMAFPFLLLLGDQITQVKSSSFSEQERVLSPFLPLPYIPLGLFHRGTTRGPISPSLFESL